MTRCYRCNTPVEETRRKVLANDSTDATIAHYEGRFCNHCWEIVVAVMTGQDSLGNGADTRARNHGGGA